MRSRKKSIRLMFTDPTHRKSVDPGKLEGNTVFTYLDAFDLHSCRTKSEEFFLETVNSCRTMQNEPIRNCRKN